MYVKKMCSSGVGEVTSLLYYNGCKHVLFISSSDCPDNLDQFLVLI